MKISTIRILFASLLLVGSVAADPNPAPTPSKSDFPVYKEPPLAAVKKQDKTTSKRVDRQYKKFKERVFDKDLIDFEELPTGVGFTATAQGWKSETGQIYDRKWLEERRKRQKKSS